MALPETPQPAPTEKSLPDLFSDLAQEVTVLVREEVKLARAEISGKVAGAVRNVAFIAVGAALAFAAYLALQFALIAALSLVLPVWAAALIVGVVVTAIAAALAMAGINGMKNQDLVPRKAMESLKEDALWVKQQVKQG